MDATQFEAMWEEYATTTQGVRVNSMDVVGCETGEFSCDMEVLACPNGDRLAKKDSLAPPTSRTPASNAGRSDSDMPIAVVNAAWVWPLPGSQMEGATFPDSVMTEIFDEPVCVLGEYEKKEVGEG